MLNDAVWSGASPSDEDRFTCALRSIRDAGEGHAHREPHGPAGFTWCGGNAPLNTQTMQDPINAGWLKVATADAEQSA